MPEIGHGLRIGSGSDAVVATRFWCDALVAIPVADRLYVGSALFSLLLLLLLLLLLVEC